MPVSFITHNNKQILYLDVTNSPDVETSMAQFDEAKRVCQMQPEKSVLLLTDVTGAHYNTEATNHMKEFSAAITPYVRASAAVGVTGIMRIIVRSLIRISGRDIRIFDTIDEAKDWLVEQAED